MQTIKFWQCRWSPTLGDLESSHQEVWGTQGYMDLQPPTVFFGLYGLPDFYTLWRHRGEKHILWAGSDIRHFVDGYWLDDKGSIRLSPRQLAIWINRNCTSWVENEVEYKALMQQGIESKIVPSFLGDVNKFKVSFKPGNKLYTSVSGDDFKLYGWDRVPDLAVAFPDIEFHLYGNTVDVWPLIKLKNIIVHGRVPKEQMNAEIKEMQGALRLTEFDGFSEIIAKSILMGQYPVSVIPYNFMLPLTKIDKITTFIKPNTIGRKYYLKHLNKYPWNTKQ